MTDVVKPRFTDAYEVGLRAQQVASLHAYEAHNLRSRRCAGGIHVGFEEVAEPAPFVILLGQAFERFLERVTPATWRERAAPLRPALGAEYRRWFSGTPTLFSWPTTPQPSPETPCPLQSLVEQSVAQLNDTAALRTWLHLGMEVARVGRTHQGGWRWASPGRLKELAEQAGVTIDDLFPRVAVHTLLQVATIPELFVGWHRVEEGLVRLRGRISPLADEARHSSDFRSVFWFGCMYYFTPDQAACVRVLWRDWENGTPEVGQDTLKEKAGYKSKRPVDFFKDNDAWGAMIVSGTTRGTFRLQPPSPATETGEAVDEFVR
jgi:hypothetical protein